MMTLYHCGKGKAWDLYSNSYVQHRSLAFHQLSTMWRNFDHPRCCWQTDLHASANMHLRTNTWDEFTNRTCTIANWLFVKEISHLSDMDGPRCADYFDEDDKISILGFHIFRVWPGTWNFEVTECSSTVQSTPQLKWLPAQGIRMTSLYLPN